MWNLQRLGIHGWGPMAGSGIGTAIASSGWWWLVSNPSSWAAAIALLGGAALGSVSYYNLVRERIEVGIARRKLISIQNHINEQRLIDGKPLVDLLDTGILGSGPRSQSKLADMALGAVPSGSGSDIGCIVDIDPAKPGSVVSG